MPDYVRRVSPYAPDGERAGKSFGGNATSFLGNDAEFLVNAANPSGLLTSTLHPDVKREGLITAATAPDAKVQT